MCKTSFIFTMRMENQENSDQDDAQDKLVNNDYSLNSAGRNHSQFLEESLNELLYQEEQPIDAPEA